MSLKTVFHITILTGMLTWILPSHAGGCVEATPELLGMEQRKITLTTDSGNHSLNAYIADQAHERAAGFQHICPDAYKGLHILFAYRHEISAQFHMRNVYSKLDIGFFDARGRLIDVQTMHPYPPGARSGPLTGPPVPFRFALEAEAGYFAVNQLHPGKTTLQWPD